MLHKITILSVARALALIVAGWVSSGAAASAQILPDGPVSLGGGRLVLGGDASLAVSSSEPGFFNYTDYDHDAMRMLRLNLVAALRAAPRVSVLAELRSENLDAVHASALYVRVRPWANHAIDIQAGRVPPNFGAFSRRSYGSDQPLIGYPLAYQYLTSIRADAVPATVDELLQMRGRGWRLTYSVGNQTADHGVPLVSAFRWDTGVQAHVAAGPVDASLGVTVGTLSNPRIDDDNDGRQISGRLGVTPVPGLLLGASAAGGAFVSHEVTRTLGLNDDGLEFTQRALGIDAEYSRDYWLVRSEIIWSRWRLPSIAAPALTSPLDARAAFVEGRYKLTPAFYIAGRLDRLDFSKVSGSAPENQYIPWDAPVTRLEFGGGYYIRRNLIGKLTFQQNARDTHEYDDYGQPLPDPQRTAQVGAQLVYWF